MYCDYDGNPIPMMVWARLLEDRDDPNGRWRVALYEGPEGDVSTVWLGLNTYLSAPPLIYESAVFIGDRVEKMVRYSTREEAQKGHDDLVAELKGEAPRE